MSINFATKKKFILDLLTRIDGQFLAPREIGAKYHEQFSLPPTVLEPVGHLHRILQALFKEGLIQTMGKGSSMRYGIGKTMRTPITLQAKFIDYYIKNSTDPMEEWINDPSRPTIKGMDFRIVQKLNGSFVHLILYFSHPVRLKKEETIGTVWIVKPRSHKFPKGKFECRTMGC